MKLLYKYGMLSLTLLLLLTFLLIYLTDHYILTAGFYENNGDPLSGIPGQDLSIYQALQKWVYFSSVVYLLMKISVIALIIHTALFMHNEEVSFRSVLKITILAEFIFLIPAAIKILSFHYTFEHGNLLDWHRYYILSALSLFNNAPADWFYALQTFNLFEVAYWFLLALGISKISELNYDESLKLVALSYIPGLLVWIAAVTFFSLILFPATG
ncbi:hypothetical protein ACFFGT_02900 [Mucilaginibacter angelicae]|uniref:DUF4271 domain-containing protein n=1 Tax=Mucilaginibacter angelicae TaxID=869718 RepID=A0ABV6L379_9SPHI